MKISGLFLLSCLWVAGCSTLPSVNHTTFTFPKDKAFIGDTKRPYQTLGMVRAKEGYHSLDPVNDEADLCRNYYNKAVNTMVDLARDKGGDAVIDVKSVVFLEDGRREEYKTPECADDGLEGQVLTQGIAIKWVKLSNSSPVSDKTFKN